MLYGTTCCGGSNSLGTVFQVSRDGSKYRVLHHFTLNSGSSYGVPVVISQGSDGALYGTAAIAVGFVFKLNPDGTGYTVLHQFDYLDLDDALAPRTGVLEGSDQALYGTSEYGGMNNGTVFRVNKDGNDYRILHHFPFIGDDGSEPQAGLMEGRDGALYGTTSRGGSNHKGTVYKLNKDGSGYAILHHFPAFAEDGWEPRSGLVEGSDGSLYGCTYFGGIDSGIGSGTIYRLSKDGTRYTVLHGFSRSAGDGYWPVAHLIQGSDGAFYGTTRFGGDQNFGIVFRLLPPETPDLIGVTFAGNAAQVRFAGQGGCRYRLLRSADLVNWQAAFETTMPDAGIAVHSDISRSESNAYYRAVWVP